ncbi:MAG: hypothetical protein COA78_38540 [Blastopirellula sp.]|nr:MAG: hypothetical protein COA78_38540 [Blastopirellula sp.]
MLLVANPATCGRAAHTEKSKTFKHTEITMIWFIVSFMLTATGPAHFMSAAVPDRPGAQNTCVAVARQLEEMMIKGGRVVVVQCIGFPKQSGA